MDEIIEEYYVCRRCVCDGIRSAKGSCPVGCKRRAFFELNRDMLLQAESPELGSIRRPDNG